jgi:NADH-quinone oxidoreductase subunit G
VDWDEAITLAAGALQRTIDQYGPQAVALLASPQMTNEELFQLARLFRSHLKVENIECRVPQLEAVYSDDFLVTADKNPNARGAEILGFSGAGVEALLQACDARQVRFLYLCHHDLTRAFDAGRVADALGKLDCLVFHGSFDHASAALADIQLASAVYAEKSGTFTNFQGRVQRFQAAIPPIGQALPDLDIISRLAAAMGSPQIGGSPGQVFREIGAQVAAFEGMTYESVGDSGQMLKLG